MLPLDVNYDPRGIATFKCFILVDSYEQAFFRGKPEKHDEFIRSKLRAQVNLGMRSYVESLPIVKTNAEMESYDNMPVVKHTLKFHVISDEGIERIRSLERENDSLKKLICRPVISLDTGVTTPIEGENNE